MRVGLFFLFLLSFSFSTNAQQPFPQSWQGKWRGQLKWYKTGKTEPQEVNMELRIRPTDSINVWVWQIIYGDATKDNRPYFLSCKDSAGVHWQINENNGIILDQFFIANKLSGAFTVQNSTIINNYWMEDDKLMVEFYSISAKPIATTGSGTKDSPSVDSYKVGSYQKAVLLKQY